MTDTVSRVIPPIWWRRIAIGFIITLALLGVSLLCVVLYTAWTLGPIDPKNIPADAPGWITWSAPFYQRFAGLCLFIFALVGVAAILFMLLLGIVIVRADKIKLFGQELSVSDRLRELEESLLTQGEEVVSLKENVLELQSLLDELNQTLRAPSVERYYELLDKLTEVAAFIMRPARALRVSLWLYNPGRPAIKIVSGYRMSHDTLRNFSMTKDDQGFVAFLLRGDKPRPRVLTDPQHGNDWLNDPDAAHKTTEILGQPVEIGKPGGWRAAICFSTDRDLAAYPAYRFSIEQDAGLLRLFASLVSSILTLAAGAQDKDSKPLIERIWMRYNTTE